jgi:UDP-glucose 4-epimerase
MRSIVQPVSFRPPKPPYETVLVTGAAGFIGSRAVHILTELGCKIVAVDNMYVGLPMPAASPSVIPVDVDIRDREALKRIFLQYRPDAILHLAAVHHIPTCERDPHLALDVNVLGTQSLLEAADAAGTRNIVMASSGAVYVWDSGALVEGVTATGAKDIYAITKLSNEYQISCWAARTGGRGHMVRLFNTIGHGDPNGHLIPDILEQVARDGDRPTVRLGNTAPKRDYIYVDDTASGFVTVLSHLHEGPASDVFNLCTGQELSVLELVQEMGEILGKQITVESDPSRIRKVDRLQQLGTPQKLMEKTGWAPSWTIRDALTEIITRLGYETVAAKNPVEEVT